ETAFMAAAMVEAVGQLKNQQREMKARAEASERLSSEIIASMTSGVLVVGHEGAIRTLNPAGAHLLELPDAGSHDSSYIEVLRDRRPLADLIEECLSTGRALVRQSISMPRPDGRTAHLGVTVSPIRDETGKVSGTICLFTDLSDVVDLEEQLRLKDSLARLGELTAGIAHEFRNGLATIHGYGRLIDPERLPTDYKPYVAGIREETEALGQVVTNFLNFAKPAELVLTPVEMRSLVQRAADDVRGEVQARGGSLDINGEFAQVDGDEVMLRQAFSNLCRNALEACADARVAPRIAVDGAVDAAQGTLRITVRDNGPGVSDATANRIFWPFFTTKAKGTGLGLALVQKIIVTHNGRVSASNADGGGAVFTVSLPVRAATIADL
ncbi:MAG TPA: ATP-binding protein, partial [Vicinamibacterales bacterium]|nr:ATP-binding protein [Vicinamibacterales bacterium]